VKTAEAQVERDRTNLRYAVIRSPIAGVVINRQVNVGQTVAASFQTPTLFQIAQDLRKMQIDTSVAEADVGSLSTSFPVSFTVDAFPGKTFQGRILQIRLNPTIQANVVTYNVVVEADNPEGKLLPGMTAHVSIRVAERRDALRVQNAALSFRPKDRGDDEPAGKAARGTRVYLLDGTGPVRWRSEPASPTATTRRSRGRDRARRSGRRARDRAEKDAAEKTFRFRMM